MIEYVRGEEPCLDKGVCLSKEVDTCRWNLDSVAWCSWCSTKVTRMIEEDSSWAQGHEWESD